VLAVVASATTMSRFCFDLLTLLQFMSSPQSRALPELKKFNLNLVFTARC